jgi:hypothetical protein
MKKSYAHSLFKISIELNKLINIAIMNFFKPAKIIYESAKERVEYWKQEEKKR